jgi:hypothetical protein
VDKTELRLECMKLAITRTVDLNNCLAWGEKIFEFVTKDAPEEETPKPAKGPGGKQSENAKILP